MLVAWVLAVLCLSAAWCVGPAVAKEAQWIWSPEHAKDQVPEVSCYFRKVFTAENPIRVQATIAADDEYVLYVNGRRVGEGKSSRELDEYNITQNVRRGRNTIAVRVTNTRGSTAALVTRIFLREKDSGWVTFSTDDSWRTNIRPFPLWNAPVYNDRFWKPAQTFGNLGDTVPWDRQEDVASTEVHRSERFRISREFQVQRVIAPDDTGSLIAMAFNEFGQIVLSQEGGPLMLADDDDKDDIVDALRIYCDKLTNVQGILPLNGQVYVTGDGPEGNGFYALGDQDRDGKLEDVKLLFNFEGEVGEHSAHGITLGPDGLLYIVIGNHSAPLKEYAPSSPHHDFYEGDLVRPKYEDPGGHAAGRAAPGGSIIRTDLSGQTVELFAGGLRNVYDLAFSPEGELFVHDSDMESDVGTVWYRPTRVFHVPPGAELGWRSGWSKWPEYYVDVLPGIADTGRGSPTGCIFYTHHMFPERYHNALFLADWSEGRILSAQLKRNGASYTANTEVFLEGQPLNVTDLDVGPDGWLYFITGGRGTGGGVYRVTYTGNIPESVRNLGSGISPAIRMPQLQSAWSRQEIARVRQKLGEDWGPLLLGVTRSPANPAYYRIRALDLMQLYGPSPSVALLTELSSDPNESIRAKAVELMGLYGGDETYERMLDLLEDSDRYVRRKAMEALARAEQTAPPDILIPILASDDRFEAWSARRLLERCPPEQWRQKVLSAESHRVAIQGALALLIAQPSEENAQAVLERMSELISGFVSDRDFIDMLRVMQVAMHRGQMSPADLTTLRTQLADEFPAGDHVMNRELVRLLVFLDCSSIMGRYFAYLESDAPNPDKVHLAMHLRFLKSGWTTERKMELFRFIAEAKQWDGGSSYPLYLGNAARDVAKSLTTEESIEILPQGAELTDAALGALYKLPAQLDDNVREALEQLDEKIDQRTDSASKQLMVGIVAVLARSGDPASMSYLRQIWDRNPERREPVAMGLAQAPEGENWEYLVQSLPILESVTLHEVIRRIQSVDQKPEDPEQIRQLILSGLRLQKRGSQTVLALLEQWTGQQLGDPSASWQDNLALWQEWFAKEYPDLPPPTLPVDTEGSKWKFDELYEFLTSEEGLAGDSAKGAVAFEKATCDKCHRYGNVGEAMGPDLTDLTKRFTRKEILQSILYPSHVISSQYAAKTLLLADGRVISGIVGPGPSGEKLVLTSEGEKISIPEQDIDEISPSRISGMPEGLFKELTQEDIADLFSYLSGESVVGLAERPSDASEQTK
jgi:putative heme-binding domain-containing protein